MLIARFVLSGHGTHCRDSQPENAFSPASTRNRKKLQNRLFVLNVFNFMPTLDYTECSQSADKRYVYRSPQAKLETRRLCDEVCVFGVVVNVQPLGDPRNSYLLSADLTNSLHNHHQRSITKTKKTKKQKNALPLIFSRLQSERSPFRRQNKLCGRFSGRS